MKLSIGFLLFSVLMMLPPPCPLFAEAGTGLQTSVSGDILGSFGSSADKKLAPREGEVILYSPTDQLFDGRLNLSAHEEVGAFNFEIHELYIGSTKLIPRSRFRVGHFFLGIGRLNQFHRHDWPFTSAPKVQSEFLAVEGIRDSGVEYSYLLPTPFFLDLTVGVTNGWNFGGAEGLGVKPVVPIHYARLVTYNSLFNDGGMQTGLNYLGHKDSSGTQTTLLGLDLTTKWREAQVLNFLFQSELWYRMKTPAEAVTENTVGFYIYPQFKLTQTSSLGVRFDGFSVLGGAVPGVDFSVVPTLSYKASEFSTIRASFDWSGNSSEGFFTNTTQTVLVQAVFILGSHPAHDF